MPGHMFGGHKLWRGYLPLDPVERSQMLVYDLRYTGWPSPNKDVYSTVSGALTSSTRIRSREVKVCSLPRDAVTTTHFMA